MIERLETLSSRLKLNLLLGASALFSVAMIAVRVYASGSESYIFLIWNLFLAVIPFAISSLLVRTRPSALVFYPLAALWLLFFPNAPYVLTDFIHLRHHDVPIWYDLILFSSFAWNGLMLGFVSLSDMQGLVRQKFNAVTSWLFATAALVLGSFGIYLGRFLEWNSWDVVTEPRQLAGDILERVSNPLAHLGTYAFTLLMTVFLLLAYLLMQVFQAKNKATEKVR